MFDFMLGVEIMTEAAAALSWGQDQSMICQRPARKARGCCGNLWAERQGRAKPQAFAAAPVGLGYTNIYKSGGSKGDGSL